MNQVKPLPPDAPRLPLAGLRVVEFTHKVMGSTCGMVLAKLGYSAARVEALRVAHAVA